MIFQDCKAIIFDMDGVLWNSCNIHYEAYCKVLIGEGLQVPAYSKLAGRRTKDVFYEILTEQVGIFDEELVQRLTIQKQMIANERLNESPPIAKNCSIILRILSDNYRLVLASSGSRQNVQLFLTYSESATLFEVILSGDDVSVAKPNPEIYLLALEKLGINSNECLVIEDSLSGIEAATLAGLSTIAITGTHSFLELSKSASIAIIDRLDQLCAS